MKISDFIEDTDNIQGPDEALDLGEVEKTAELLEAFSEEDTLLDDLAKLAVLQDIVGQNQVELEKVGWRIGTAKHGFGAMSDMQKANKQRRKADKLLRVNEVKHDAAKLQLEAEELARKSEKLSNKDGESMLGDSVVPFIVGGGAAAAGTGIYMKKQQDKKINEIAQYYENVQSNNK